MSFRTLPAFLLLAALPALSAGAAEPPKSAPNMQTPDQATGESSFHRIGLPGESAEKPFPYTVEVPAGWSVRQLPNTPGLWIGPVGAQPPNDPHLIYIRISPSDMSDAEKAAANIRASDAKNDTWSAPLVEVKDLAGVKAVLVRMDSGSADKARSTLALKLPFEKGGVDFMASAPRAEFEKMLPVYQRILLSVRRRAS